MARRLLIAVLIAALALAGPAWAHTDVSAPAVPVLAELGSESLRADAPVSSSPWLLATALAATAALALRRRRVLVVALLVLLAFGAFETGLHSVHHLGKPDGASCAVATVSSQVGAVAVDVVALERPADVLLSATPTLATGVVRSRLSAPDLGRAPPAA
jgi:hypothetical protein